VNSPKDRAADHNPDDVRSIARRLAGLQELGFQRVDVSAPVMESTPLDGRTWKTIASRPAMSTLVTVTVISRSPTRAEEAAGRAFEEMDVLIGILSRFDPASPLTYLNQQGRISGAPPELARVVRQGLRFHQLSSGSFDPTVLLNGGYDPEEFSGFAFGMGPERTTILRYHVEDIRHLWTNDLRFLEQF